MHLKGTRIGAYARYSSDKQRESSVEDQLRRFRKALAPQGLDLDPKLTFKDHAISGKSTDERDGFDALMRKVKARELDVLMVEDVSRLARNQSDASRLYEDLKFYGVQLLSLDDGIDSTSKGAKLQYGVKSLFADLYLDDLREKTLRGMEGRALAGHATGGRLLGYRSVPQLGADGRTPTGFTIEVDPEAADLVRRIFALYLAGQSFHGIARILNKEDVPSPREKTQHARKSGWPAGTIRALLYNERYAGVWTFNERRWVRIPGTNKRRPEKKDPSEIIRTVREDIRIIDSQMWDAVQDRLRRTKDKFTSDPDGKPKGRAHGAVTLHPFSGVLVCGKCEGPMTIMGGDKTRRYYACQNYRRGRCDNAKKVRADLARNCILGAVRTRLMSPDGIAYARRRVAEGLAPAAK